jgi:hypothetical protein
MNTTTIVRVVVVGTVLASLVLAGAAPIHAADPTPSGRLGGEISATPSAVFLTSNSSTVVQVEMTADGPFTVTPATFLLDPGERATLAVAGTPMGYVSAKMTTTQVTVNGDTPSVVLEVAFPQPAPWTPPWHLILGATLVLSLAGYGAIRVRRFTSTHAIVRKES